MSRIRLFLLLGAAIPLAACGADDIASPGTGGNIIINNPAPSPSPSPSPSPTPTPTPGVTPAADCGGIAGVTDSGQISGPTGTYRVCTLPSQISQSIQLAKVPGRLYRINGRVDVGTDGGPTASAADTNVTLTIDPGVILFAESGASWVLVNRGNKISAVGTATQPIIFTSRQNVVGLTNETGSNSSGLWGGVVLAGRAQITDCATGTPGTATCERQTEGAIDPARYGGATNTDNSGTISFAQIRYSGFILSGNSELQSLTTEGIGRATKLDHIMSFNSSDDGAEFFGGRVNMKYFVSIGAEDDNLDTDTGVKANFQYVLVVQKPDVGDSIIEADTDNTADVDTPRQNTIVSNMTAIHRFSQSNNTAVLLRGGTDYTIANSIITSPTTCLRISNGKTIQAADPAQDDLGPPVFRSVVMKCGATPFSAGTGVTVDQVSAIFGSGSNNNNSNFTPTLTNVFVNGASETAVPAFDVTGLNADPQVTGGFFTAVSYIGAFRDANDQWYKGWVCNSSIADFGLANTTGLCTTIPVL